MKVLEVKTKKPIEVSDAFGARLIEQGMAILPPAARRQPPERPAPKAEKAAPKKGEEKAS